MKGGEALCLEACRCTHNVSNPPNPKSSKQAPRGRVYPPPTSFQPVRLGRLENFLWRSQRIQSVQSLLSLAPRRSRQVTAGRGKAKQYKLADEKNGRRKTTKPSLHFHEDTPLFRRKHPIGSLGHRCHRFQEQCLVHRR